MTAATPAIATGGTDAGVANASSAASTSPPAAPPAAVRSSHRGSDGKGRARTAAALGIPKRRRVAGSTRPPFSDSVSAGGAQLRREGVEARPGMRPRVERRVNGRAELVREVPPKMAEGGKPATREPRGDRPLGPGPRPALVQDERQGVDVGGTRHLPALRLLGCHVRERAHHVAGSRQPLLVGDVRHAEVRELREPSPCSRLGHHDHVLRLDVAMNDPARVRVLERSAQRDAYLADVAVGQRPRSGELAHGPAVDELRHQVHGLCVGAELVEPDDARVVQLGGHPPLSLRPVSDAPVLA